MSYAEAMRRYGSDKPDLRIALELCDVADLVRDCDFKVFAAPARRSARPRGGAARAGRRRADRARRSMITPRFVARYGAKGLAYIKVNERARGREGLQSPIIKFLSDAALAGILERTGAADGDLIFFGADTAKVVNDALGALRLKLGAGSRAASSRAGGRCGWWISRCSNGTSEAAALGGDAPPLYLARSIDDPQALRAQTRPGARARL